MQMIGQDKLIEKVFNELRNYSFPHSSMFLGDFGCGKHTIVGHICKHLGIECIDLSNKISLDNIAEIYNSPVCRGYYIDTNTITVKEQNAILKLLEEPCENAYIFLLCENLSYVLPTIINRCRIYEFGAYDKNCLRSFTDDEELLKYASTPGQVLKYKGYDLSAMKSLAINTIFKIKNANYANILNISKSIALKKSDTKKYDVDLFMKILLITARDAFISGELSYKPYMLIHDTIIKQHNKSINNQHLFEGFLYNLKGAVVQ